MCNVLESNVVIQLYLNQVLGLCTFWTENNKITNTDAVTLVTRSHWSHWIQLLLTPTRPHLIQLPPIQIRTPIRIRTAIRIRRVSTPLEDHLGKMILVAEIRERKAKYHCVATRQQVYQWNSMWRANSPSNCITTTRATMSIQNTETGSIQIINMSNQQTIHIVWNSYCRL